MHSPMTRAVAKGAVRCRGCVAGSCLVVLVACGRTPLDEPWPADTAPGTAGQFAVPPGVSNLTGGTGGQTSGVNPGSGAAGPAASGSGGTISSPPNEPPADGCSALRRLDAREVYLLGTLQEGSSDVIAHWSDANHALAGFPSQFEYDAAVIDPSDGSLVFTLVFDRTIRRFRADACFVGGRSQSYPMDTVANDVVISHPCGEPLPRKPFVVSPAGEIAVYCGGPWRSPDGRIVYGGGAEVLSYGYSGSLLTRRGVYSIAERSFHSFNGLPVFGEREPVAVRATNSGFWLVLMSAESVDEHDQWLVDFSGAATYVGRYASHSPRADLPKETHALAADGALFSVVYDVDGEELLERRTLSETEVVYDEGDEPLVQLHGSGLFTGP